MAKIVEIGAGSGQPPGEMPDAHGQAALMLSESILHALVDAGTFTTEDALAIIAVAQEVKEETGKAARETAELVAKSLSLLGKIATSFGTDLQDI